MPGFPLTLGSTQESSPPKFVSQNDSTRWIRRCLELANLAAGQTAPNPMVGCVVLKDGIVVGEGFHPGAGQPHAEVFALTQAGDRARGATLYVNLEPCNHTGRTPPCTDAVIRAGLSRVVVGMVDPDPRVSGSGIDRLRQAGVEVEVGVEEAACQRLNEAFVQRVTHQRPLGLLKYAMTLDGKIAATGGHSAWVTGPTARAAVHQLRATCDAVVVGGNTVRRDDPRLTSHGHGSHNPLRVVMSRRLDLPAQANLWQTNDAPTVVFTAPDADSERQQLLSAQGVEVIELPALTPRLVTAQLYQRGCAAVLWECGGLLAAEAIKDGVIDKLWAFVAPKLVGGTDAPGPVGNLGIHHMGQALALERTTWRTLGNDLLLEAYLRPPGLA
ncbi:bifunctional diaminohydroxyphosphoribosylaminopyrimidine deaminase/5-amino-6-(5-phosphoribosylamino)uracil reductase RibD [Nodosilinea sp. LEGE 06152]|uniref:bifunctional diaminohydroxyphosphoribosylaminopyrimidine deaminase/5-amino-6-(5-phosphoribosylamino)uracil reductase RibD n=1 Tax=Nodosilinea sp. LEGE 06152 TaxID=2777966 RepID=UPI00188292C8|nr:bifunctional diaminohydroxyphosphoribosylaminopyrimidine deaminase/5-amino-6-(5-phosphoribosylamino)uracil reductase RibD [Nodosilinea sp. LEGE 06152]MBE9157137.1 bifunctional diaminohydroxyphosphoribosylaminopyrimidine deaminase/5-amino-6-(5-phosphoribosylamino)uracil reductase RibD [Nodosilinea sp. LEGE 06152]